MGAASPRQHNGWNHSVTVPSSWQWLQQYTSSSALHALPQAVHTVSARTDVAQASFTQDTHPDMGGAGGGGGGSVAGGGSTQHANISSSSDASAVSTSKSMYTVKRHALGNNVRLKPSGGLSSPCARVPPHGLPLTVLPTGPAQGCLCLQFRLRGRPRTMQPGWRVHQCQCAQPAPGHV